MSGNDDLLSLPDAGSNHSMPEGYETGNRIFEGFCQRQIL
jgi:hypothetical protein